ncbi:MAG: transglutaminase family protein [Gammaproteobacteria bacterium]|nr:transglutaminase family protein [Gammaproteobacteria bacterium]MDP2140071.1 transglutaminase family protein [Gammaproteobacteria bacterium]MDP2347633.1 transglutaminase family protein [Gammaproteobacteria bacterium]
MTIKVAIHHQTTYRFDRLVQINPHVVRLRPAPHCRTPINAYSLKISPTSHFINWQQDPFSNHLARLVFPEKAKELSITVELIADMTVINPFDFFVEESAEHFPFKYDPQLAKDLAPYLEIKETGPQMTKWLKGVNISKQPIVSFLVAENSRTQNAVNYVIRMEPGVQTCEETLTRKLGSCRDSAWLLVQTLRHMGLAARFASGYLVQLTADVRSIDGPSGPTEDFTDLHAWTEVFIPGAGWVGLDPTSGLFAAEGHIPLACTPDPVSAAPITGSTGVSEVQFFHENKVTRIHEDPRVTKPYTGDEWKKIDALGLRVDEELLVNDVRLTVGGEPTFISIDDMESPQWNTAALGKEKRKLAGELLLALKKHYGPQGIVHIGQGKWYPGEPLPRWALGLFWRTDSKPLWHNPQLLADDRVPGPVNMRMAANFIGTLARRLRISPRYVLPAFEDKSFYLKREAELPANVSLWDNKVVDPLESARIKRVFAQGLDKETGYVLPLSSTEIEGEIKWLSCKWYFRKEKLVLLPGDSPVGFRLPLDSLPWQAPDKNEQESDRDPFAPREELPYPLLPDEIDDELDAAEPSDGRLFHTAMCAEVRDGRLYLFLPPQTDLERYVALLAAIEAIAEELTCPLVIEGYEPPKDHRLQKLMITPDPGVIEVNVQPTSSWPELTSLVHTLYEQARQNRLGTDKFMLDGRHMGTGGGNHVTLGAAKPEDSPFLRRPDLLGSLLRYWQNHPSLSYLFSGQFIGPTSQAPRVDEARDDNLYELEIALQQLENHTTGQYWLVDRILRNFLVDLTGNTHRAEFCIDKLYSPDSASGRLGIVEFRNFEMPPHWQMSALQVLLLRTLVAHFWQKPYDKPLVNWGTELHDRFMLPYFVWEDLGWVVDDLNKAGYPFSLEWFAPFQEFRFPHYGTIHTAGIQLDLQRAIEPWHVLGEESTGQGTARYVDSSVERLQVRTQNMTGNRFIITCNGRKIPMRSTGTEGEFVAGIRYKAWAPYSALHPTIGVHSPLVIDIVDTHHNRSLGGCTYHVSHPGGRNYDTFPVNANEAEARRVARFWQHGHTQGVMDLDLGDPHAAHPYTLDMRFRSR